jgi:hypothetical protein
MVYDPSATYTIPGYKAGKPAITMQQGTQRFGLPDPTKPMEAAQGRTTSHSVPGLKGALSSVLGMDFGTGALSEGSVLKGPQNAFTPAMMQQLQAQALQKLQMQQGQTMAGLGQAAAARGTAGIDAGAVMGNLLDANMRGDLAKLGLETELQGRDLGLKEHAARLDSANLAGGLYQTERGMEEDYFNNQWKQSQSELTQAQSALDNFNMQYGTQLTKKSGGKQDEALLDAARSQANKFQEQGKSLENPDQYLDMLFPTSGAAYDEARGNFLEAVQKQGQGAFPDWMWNYFDKYD